MIQEIKYPMHFADRIDTVVPDKIYFRYDGAPDLSLAQVTELTLEQKRTFLYGQCLLDRCLTDQQKSGMLINDSYLQLEHPGIKNIFFVPMQFLTPSWYFVQNRVPARVESRVRVPLTAPMNTMRYARMIASCWLANHADFDFLYTQNWSDDQQALACIDELLQIGSMRDWTGSWGPVPKQLPRNFLDCTGAIEDFGGSHTAQIFSSLRDEIYAPAASCLVIQSTFWEHGCELNEKYLFAVYSGCIPLVQGYRIYDRLRDLGFDVFDDIIDTTSQHESNPVRAAWMVLEHNRDFLARCLELHKRSDIQQRLWNNIKVAQDVPALYRRCLHRLNDADKLQIFYQYHDEIWQFLRLIHADLSDHTFG